MPIRFGGAAELIDALGGGSRIERESYGREAQRLMTAANTQASMEKRVEEAYALSQQNDARDSIQDNPFDLTKFQDMTPENHAQLLISGLDVNNTLGGLGKSQEIDQRARLEAARLGEGFGGGNALVNAIQASPTLTPKIDVKGGIGLTGQYGDDPQLAAQAVLDALNSGSASAGQPGVREQKIQDWMRITNPRTGVPYTRQEAFLRVDPNGISIETDPITGVARVVDSNQESVREIPLDPNPVPEDQLLPTPDSESLYGLAPEAGGLGPAINTAVARTASIFNASYDESATEARQTFATEMNTMLMALSINAKMPVKEIERIEKQIDITPTWSKGGPFIRKRMKSIDATLRRMHNDAVRSANQAGGTRETRTNAKFRAQAIGRFLESMDVPQDVPPEVQAQIRSEMQSLPGFNEMSPEDQQELIDRSVRERQ